MTPPLATETCCPDQSRASSPRKRLTCYYDQDCGICQATVRFLRGRGAESAVEFIGNLEREAFHDDIPNELLMRTIVVVDRGTKRQYTESRAVALLLSQLPRPWSWLRVTGVPGLHLVSDLGYWFVARNRRRISSLLGLDACQVRPPQAKDDDAS